MKKPSKRLYPDYYQYITHPMALDDIKSDLEKNRYPTLEDVRLDFELCFNNAMHYNLPESQIWIDAKELLVSRRPTTVLRPLRLTCL